MLCNKCSNEPKKGKARLTKCHHVYCVKCLEDMRKNSGQDLKSFGKFKCIRSDCNGEFGRPGVLNQDVIDMAKRDYVKGTGSDDDEDVDEDDLSAEVAAAMRGKSEGEVTGNNDDDTDNEMEED